MVTRGDQKVTHSEDVLRHILISGGPMTAAELAQATEIKEGTLATVLWKMHKKKLIEPVGGKRGSYEYGLTPRGRSVVAKLSAHSLSAQADLKERTAKEKARREEAAFYELKKVLASAKELELLQKFIGWLVRKRPDLLASEDQSRNEEQLVESAMRYLGIEPQQLKDQRAQLDKLLSRGR